MDKTPHERPHGPGHAIQRGAPFVHPAAPQPQPVQPRITDMAQRFAGAGHQIARGTEFMFPSEPPKPEQPDAIHKQIMAQLAER